MPDFELLTGLDRKLIDMGIIREEYAGEYGTVHEAMKQFRAGTGMYFSTKDLREGEQYLRGFLQKLGTTGAPRTKLSSFLKCGLAHLCYDFIEFTFECIPGEEITQRALLSFMSRNYHQAVLPDGKGKRAKGPLKKSGKKMKTMKPRPAGPARGLRRPSID